MKFIYYPTIEIPIIAKDRDDAWKKAKEFNKQWNKVSLTRQAFRGKKIIDGELEDIDD